MKKVLVGLIVLLAACTHAPEPDTLSNRPMQVQATLAAGTSAISTLALTIDNPVNPAYSYTNLKLVSSGAALRPEGDIQPLWQNGRQEVTVSAWAPYLEGDITSPYPFCVAADQTTIEAREASDFLWAKELVDPDGDQTDKHITCSEEGILHIGLQHTMSKLVVRCTLGNELGDATIQNVAIKNMENACLLDLEAGTTQTPTTSVKKDIFAHKEANTTYAALFPPQQTPFAIMVEMSDGRTFIHENAAFDFQAGWAYTISLNIGKEKVEINGEVTLSDWEYGESLGEGQATNDYMVYHNGFGSVYHIYTLKGLLEVNKILSAPDVTADMLKANLILYDDFVLPAPADGQKSNWNVLGSEWKPFTGDVEGNNHTIYGLVIDSTGYDIGMFGDISGGIRNLTLVGCQIKGNGHVGGFVGYRIGSNTVQIENCIVKATKEYPVVIESTDCNVGGIVGSNMCDELVNCSLICEKDASITIKGIGEAAYNVGGIAGRNCSGTTTGCKVINNGGKIEITNADADYVAGLIGRIENQLHSCSVSGATITGRNHVGGLIGYLDEIGRVLTESKVEYCTITGKSHTSATYGSKHQNSYWTPIITIGQGNVVNGVAVTPSN